MQGAQQVRCPGARCAADPAGARRPSTSSSARLRGRGTESEERIAARLDKADWELAQRGWFDQVVVNDDVEHASSQVAAIIDGSRASPRPTGTTPRRTVPDDRPQDRRSARPVDSKYTLVTLSAKRARRSTPTTTSSARAAASSCRRSSRPASGTSRCRSPSRRSPRARSRTSAPRSLERGPSSPARAERRAASCSASPAASPRTRPAPGPPAAGAGAHVTVVMTDRPPRGSSVPTPSRPSPTTPSTPTLGTSR